MGRAQLWRTTESQSPADTMGESREHSEVNSVEKKKEIKTGR